MKTSATIALCMLLAFVPALTIAGAERMQGVKALPEQITPLTQEQLNTVVPHFYCFDYRFAPQPGKRYWLRVSNTKWIERYPDGMESVFKTLGHTTVKDFPGTIVVKVSGDAAKTGPTARADCRRLSPTKAAARCATGTGTTAASTTTGATSAPC